MCSITALILLLTVIGGAITGNADNADSVPSGSTGFAYSGSFAGNDPSNFQIPQIPNFGFDPANTGGYFDTLRKFHENLINNIQQNAIATGGSPPADFLKGENGGSLASASIGPGGFKQTAAVFPENPESPNIFSRFGETQGTGGNGASYGVFTSSVSSSSNVDGVPKTVHRAQTVVNDNGKITTYTAKSP